MTLRTVGTRGRAGLCIAIAMAITACGSKDDPTRENFAATIDQYLQQSGRVCLDYTRWPASVMITKTSASSVERQMLALESVGLIKKVGETKPWSQTFDLTDAAKPYLVDRKFRVMKIGAVEDVSVPTLCWAQKKLQEVVQWDKPMQMGEFQMVQVLYTFKLENVAEWARRPEVQEAFPVIRQHLKDGDQGKERTVVKLTSEGWQVMTLN